MNVFKKMDEAAYSLGLLLVQLWNIVVNGNAVKIGLILL